MRSPCMNSMNLPTFKEMFQIFIPNKIHSLLANAVLDVNICTPLQQQLGQSSIQYMQSLPAT